MLNPFTGFRNPPTGKRENYTSFMEKRPKKRKFPGFMRQVVAQNVRGLVDHHYALVDNKPKKLAEDAQISLSSAQRVLSAEVGASIDTLEAIANVFEISVYQLVLPNLDAHNPQVVTGATAAERAMYAAFRRGQMALEKQKT